MKENKNDFEPLRRLLALKRHEVPPPGYFENFSSEVVSRIRAGDSKKSYSDLERVVVEIPWLARLLTLFEAKPMFAGSFATVLCLLLLGGIVFAERPDVTPKPLFQMEPQSSAMAVAAPIALPETQTAAAEQSTFVSSTNPVFNAQSAPSWFNAQPATLQQVNFNN